MNNPTTVAELFLDSVDRYSTKRAALRYKANGTWHGITHQDLARRVKHTALGLRELGVSPGDRVAIFSHNRPEWAVADFACMMSGCPDVPVYPTLPANQAAYVLRDSGSVAVFVEDREQFEKVRQEHENLPDLRHIIYFDPQGIDDGGMSIQELQQLGAAHETDHPDYESRARSVKPDDLCTIIYTSGTTGNPKGVMLTHENITFDATTSLKVLPIGADDSCLSFLPLSHSFERTCGHYIMFLAGVTINYAESVDAVAQNMTEVKPTVMISVPRLYEKIFARVLENAMAGGALKRRIFFWARRNAERWVDLVLGGKPVPSGLAIKKKIADRLVFSKLRARTGGRLRYFVSGGAPLAPDIARFFFAAGLPIIEGYGLTETSPVISVNPIDAPRIGTVGKALPGVEVKIAEDGELLTRGPNVMKAYFNKPDATAETKDEDGWLHTGDIATIDEDGYIRITDRKKDIIVTAGGKNIAPQPIENRVKTNEFIENAVMLGDRRKFPVMLVVPSIDALKKWAAGRNITFTSVGELLGLADVKAKVEREVMGNLRGLASYEMPKKVILVENDFTIEGGELTPSLKVKRRVVEQKYKDLIDAVYED